MSLLVCAACSPCSKAGDVRLVFLLAQHPQVPEAEQGTLLTPAH